MKICVFLFISIGNIFLYSFSNAQPLELKFQHITSEEGLPQNTIHGIVKDKYGFMWFGTWGGLCRYDGYSFKVYTYNPKDNRSINNNRIHNLVRDKDQNIWIRTFLDDEVCRYNYEKDDFERIPKATVPEALRNALNRRHHIETVQFGYKEFLWSLDVPNNLLVEKNKISGQKKVYQQMSTNPWSLNDSYVTDIYKDNHNILWVGTFSNGINKASLNAKPFEHYFHDPVNARSIIDNNVRAICEDKSGNLWVGTRDKGITVIKKSTYWHISRKAKKNTIGDDQIRNIYCDSRGLVWIGTKESLYNYNPSNNTFRSFENIFRNISVFGITEDKDHNILLATWNGIYKYLYLKDQFINFDWRRLLKSSNAKVIVQDSKGRLWVGTDGGGVTILKPTADGGNYTVVQQLLHYPNFNSLSDNRINCIYEDSDCMMWIGTGNGLDKYDPENNRFIDLGTQRELKASPVVAVVEDWSGFLWISTKKGISKLDRKSLKARNFTLQDGLQSNEFSDGTFFKSNHQKKLFFGGNNGFNAFDPKSILAEKTLPNTVLTRLQVLNRLVNINEEVNGRIILSKPLYLTPEIELTHGDKGVAIEFAGLHYSNPKANKYAYLLEGFDKDWVYTDATRRLATYSNLEPGEYTFKVISANCDGVWNKVPATLKITVEPPFWESSWAYLIYTLLLALIAYWYHYYSTRFTMLKSRLAYESLVHDKEHELQQNKLQFFTNISHEIKTPLTLILAPLDRLLGMFSANSPVHSQLLTMKMSSERLLKLVNQLLDFRKLETGNAALNPERKDIVAFLKRMTSSFSDAARTKNIDLRFRQKMESCVFFYDEDKLEKVISNLLSNAFKFTPSKGKITVRLSFTDKEDGQFAVVEVVNTGQGIPEEQRDLIFLPFRQARGNTVGGTGLGLAYSKALIELHGGTISVDSSSGSEGEAETCFTILLPLLTEADVFNGDIKLTADSAGEQLEEPSSPNSTPELKLDEQPNSPKTNGRLPQLLIVEDNIELRAYLKAYFESEFKVFEADNGVEGLKMALKELPDLILSDVMMDEMDGYGFCRRIKDDLKTAHIPLILLTAKTPVEAELEGFETGADDYITKPFNLAVLTARVKSTIASRNKLREKYRREISKPSNSDIPLSSDERMLKRLYEYLEEKMTDSELRVEDICAGVGVSRSQLYKKLRELTGLSLSEVIKEIRFRRAKQLLKEGKFSVNEVAYMVGFSDADYFRRCFKAEFAITPSEFSKQG